MIRDFASKVAVITGGGSGIGSACEQSFAHEGAAVFASRINLERAEAVAE